MSTILVIDDEPHILENIVDLLEASGYQALGAADAAAGIEMARSHQPDLIVCDVMMPKVDGYGVLRRVRQDASLQTTPFIFLTARSTPGDMRDGMSEGADDYLLKPFRSEDLLEAIEVRLDRRRTFEAHREQHLNELRRNMSAALPHELRTPLAAIQGYAEVLRSDWDQLSADEGHAMLDEILSATERLKRLSENYALYVALEAHPDDEPQAAAASSPASLIADAAHEQAAEYSRDEDLTAEVAAARLAIEGEYLYCLSVELIDNALKFSQPGQTTTVRGTIDGEDYHLQVMDRGRGMKPEQVEQLGAFVQFNRDRYEQQGVGLGLALIHRIAQRSGGSVRITSTPDEGTTVDVRLPLHSDERPAG